MELPGGLSVHSGLVLEAEHLIELAAGNHFQRGWNIAATNALYARRGQYPYNGQTVTRQEAAQVIRWMLDTHRGAQGLHQAHGAGEEYEGNIAFHPGMGTGYMLVAEFTINYTDGRPPTTIYQGFRFEQPPTAQQATQAIEDAAADYAFAYGVPGVQSVSHIRYTRYWRGQ